VKKNVFFNVLTF